ncbi:hypothetical protein P692DRAFT_201899481 [Suillus brevipes Sb2]|nr:hypothetical protein P692DRAFT_201899481 [Suillus brevipes Sb2]
MFPFGRIAIDQTPVCIVKPDVQRLNQRYCVSIRRDCNTGNEEGVPSEKKLKTPPQYPHPISGLSCRLSLIRNIIHMVRLQ